MPRNAIGMHIELGISGLPAIEDYCNICWMRVNLRFEDLVKKYGFLVSLPLEQRLRQALLQV